MRCGAVEYEFTEDPRTVHACHCTDCQKRSGSAFGLAMVVGKDSFIIKGEVASYIRTSDSGQKNTSYFAPNAATQFMGSLNNFQI
jgi:hypothetical protein